MVTMGIYFTYIMADAKSGILPSRVSKESVRAVLFVVGGISQIIPYLAVICESLGRFT